MKGFSRVLSYREHICRSFLFSKYLHKNIIVRLLRLRLRMRGEPSTSSLVLLSVLCEVSFFLIGERAGLKSPELGRPAVVGEVETCPAQLLTELAETCYLQLVVMLEDPL